MTARIAPLLAALVGAGLANAATLPAQYFTLLEAGAAKVEARFAAEPRASLKILESESAWRHFPYAILAPAVLYAKQHPQNPHYQNPKMLELAIRIGDLLAAEDEAGTFEPRLDSDWDTYMWLEAYRLLEPQLGEPRRNRWKKALLRNVALVWQDAKDRVDFPWYNSPYIGTSPNHYAQYAGNLLLAGRMFGNQEWESLGATILKRFSTVEQTEDGYWGEHSRRGPTTGYNHLTLTSVALYWEFTADPAAMQAMRRSTDFHKAFTFPDGTPVDVVNDRNRRWGVSAWGHFAFSHFADGRGYAEFLTDFFDPDNLSMSDLGRLAQNALYYHEGPASPAPQQQARFSHRMKVPAGVRKTGPWFVCLSGIVDSQEILSQFYLDRQGHIGIFHEKLGMIITGANSKRQPELAGFTETLSGDVHPLPLSSRLQMDDSRDRLSLAYNSFWTDVFVPQPSESEMSLRIVITGRGRPPDDPRLNLQLALRVGETLETGAGRKMTLGEEPIELGPAELGGWIRHHGWRMELDPTARLIWPVRPYYPYGGGAPEKDLKHAVGRLTIPLTLKRGRYIRPAEHEIELKITVEP